MKIRLLSIGIIFLLLFQACKKVPDNRQDNFQYLIDYERVTTLSKEYISGLYQFQSIQYPEILNFLDNTIYDVEIYTISYKTSYKDSIITASGVVCIPKASDAFPLVSFQNGTNTSNNNAPSIAVNNPNFTFIQSLAGKGYILSIPDYVGFGLSENIVHPYYLKETNNAAVIDMIRAVRELMDCYEGDATYSESCFLLGYSLGGWATLSALKEIELNYSDEFMIIATSCGAGAYDLLTVSNEIIGKDTYPGPLYLPYYVYSHQQYGTIHDPLNKFFQEPYASEIPGLFNGNYTNGQVNAHLNDTISRLLTHDLILNFNSSDAYSELRNDLENNSLEAWQVNSLLRFYHGNADDNVPVNQSESIFTQFVSLGIDSGTVEYYELEGLNHDTALLPWGISSIFWFDQLKAIN